MSQDDIQTTPSPPETNETSAEQPSVTPGSDGESASTVGMGTSLALGCIAGTILLIIIGLIYLGLMALL